MPKALARLRPVISLFIWHDAWLKTCKTLCTLLARCCDLLPSWLENIFLFGIFAVKTYLENLSKNFCKIHQLKT